MMAAPARPLQQIVRPHAFLLRLLFFEIENHNYDNPNNHPMLYSEGEGLSYEPHDSVDDHKENFCNQLGPFLRRT